MTGSPAAALCFRPRLAGRIAAPLLAALLAAGPIGCYGPSRVPPIGAEEGAFTLAADEQRLWERARQEERTLRDKAAVHDDPILDGYLNDVAQRLVPPAAGGAGVLRVRVSAIRDPTLNAFTYPTGSVYVHTGLLARMENEAQLAMVLGHEIGHATGRHALEFERSARNKAIGFSIASLVASVAVAGAAGRKAEQGDWSGAYVLNQVGNIMVGLGLELAFLAAVNGFGRELEHEADEEGLRSMSEAGYDTRQAARVFELLQEDHGDTSKMEVFFFGSHPRLAERVESTREIVAARYAGAGAPDRVTDTRDFQMRMRVLARDDAAANIEAGRYGVAAADLDRVLGLTPNDPVAHHLYGRLHEKRAGDERDPGTRSGLIAAALRSYTEASRLDPAYADPFRSIGILRYRAGEAERALAAFRRYLELAPNAPDARQIKDYILEIEAR